MGKIFVTKSSMPPFEEYIELIKPLWESRMITNNGVLHKKLEEELVDYLKVPNVTLFSNGHLGLEYAIELLDLKGEIITTPFTFISTTNSIIRKGLKPVFCDISKDDFNINVRQIEELINDNTSAIMPVHVYGNPCDVFEIERIAKKYSLKVIYDAAHAFGVKINGKGIGTFGDMTMFSFHATKIFHTIEGGALTYNLKSNYRDFNVLKNFGINESNLYEKSGGNGKLDEFRCAMGICNLNYIDDYIDKRRNIYNRYVENLSNIKGINFPKCMKHTTRNYSYVPVLFEGYKKTRDQVYEELVSHSIFARKYFSPLTNSAKYISDINNLTPNAEQVAKNILTLPIYYDLCFDDIDLICKIIIS